MKNLKYALALSCLAASPVQAEEPLSAIEWLKAPLPAVRASPKPPPRGGDLPVAETAAVPDIETAPLGASAPATIGLLPSSVTGLPETEEEEEEKR